MQTFLPYADFYKSAECLDNKRLNKQITEGVQIYNALTDPLTLGWKKHPAVLMWKGYEGALIDYVIACAETWSKRGFKHKFLALAKQIKEQKYIAQNACPPWFGTEEFHSAHRAILLAKSYEFYKVYNWKEPPAQQDSNGRWPYIWPKL